MNYLTYILLRVLLAVFGWLPLPVASAIGGRLAELIGPLTNRHKVALKNLVLIYPDKPESWRVGVARLMWNHLGRVLAELPGLKNGELIRRLGEVAGREHITAAKQAIYVSAHLGQWELLMPAAKANGLSHVASMYRHINNHRIDELLKSYRQPAHDELIRKKGDNAIALVRALKEGKNLALLIDQRLTKGERMKFLGVDGDTNTAAIKLSIKTGVPIVPSFITRTTGVAFKGKVYPPIYPPEQGSEAEKTSQMARQIFDCMERQIHDHPEQYLWLHNRWK